MSTLAVNLALSGAYICTSGALILYNATILKGVFPYPALLTTGHMVFSGALSHLLVRSDMAKGRLPADFLALPPMTKALYSSSILPIAGLQGLSLWLSNLAYLYISVSLIQMIKASNTVWTYLWSLPLGLATWDKTKALNLALIGAGVAAAATSAAAIGGSALGIAIQLVGIIVEAARLAMVQVLLQQRGLKLSPVTALYYIAPAVVPLLLTTAVAKGEVSALLAAGWHFPLPVMLSNMALAFSLNFIGLVVIKRMSAVAYVLSGIVKDVLLVSGGALLFGEVVTPTQVAGYAVALAGLAYYNYQGKVKAAVPSKPIAPPVKDYLLEEGGKHGGDAESLMSASTRLSE